MKQENIPKLFVQNIFSYMLQMSKENMAGICKHTTAVIPRTL